MWVTTRLLPHPTLTAAFHDDIVERRLSLGSSFALEMVFHEELAMAEFRYDQDLDDDIPSYELASIEVSNAIPRTRQLQVFANAVETDSTQQLSVDSISVRSLISGDFNYDQAFDIHDLSILANNLGSSEPRRDLNKDSIVDGTDRDIWVHEIANTYYGDANLDGEFNTADLVSIFNFAQYEDDIAGNSSWETGDWNLDGDFTTGDLVLAFQDGGYEKGPAAVVPEPEFSLLPLLVLWGMRVARSSAT